MEKYNHLDIEPKWQKVWQESEIFKTDNDSTKDPYYILVEFPYPSGDGLHVGHCRSYTALDCIARKKRLEGHEVLFPMGWDAFGLPTENYAIKNKIAPQEATAKNVANFKRQCQSIGWSFDWSREVNTTDPEYYKWTQWIFLQFFKAGLAYQKEMPINWCPHCKTGLANEEVEQGTHERCGNKVEQKNVKQWMLAITKYAERLSDDLEETDYLPHIKTLQKNWIGKSTGASITFKTDKDTELEIYTTRPDTIFGATYMVISPEHADIETLTTDAQKDAITEYQQAAKQKSELERTQLNKEKTGVFTGSFAINPVNGKEIPIWVSDYVLANYGTGAIMAVPAHDERDQEFAEKFDLDIITVIEDDKMVNSGDYNKLSPIECKDKIIADLQSQGIGKAETNFKLHDWVFSRQRYWGEPIPVVHCDDCGAVPVPDEQLPITLPEVENYEPTDDGTSPLSRIDDWVNTPCPKCDKPAKRETDTMPNWAGSSWYFLRFTDPHNTEQFASKEALAKWSPVHLYNGGMEHVTLHLLYSRFWHKFLYDQELVPQKEPYTKRVNHGMILDEHGDKMSKSRGNVVNPDDIVKEYGADTLRVYELFIGPFDQVAAWNTNGVEGVSRFLTKVWRLQDKVIDQETDKKIDQLLHKTIMKVGSDIETRAFNTAVSALMILVNEMQSQEVVSKDSLEKLLALLTPMAPHMAEEIWSNLGNTESIHLQKWPEYDEDKLQEDEVTIAVAINGKTRTTLTVSPAATEEEIKNLAMEDEAVRRNLTDKEIIKEIFVPGKMLNIVAK